MDINELIAIVKNKLQKQIAEIATIFITPTIRCVMDNKEDICHL